MIQELDHDIRIEVVKMLETSHPNYSKNRLGRFTSRLIDFSISILSLIILSPIILIISALLGSLNGFPVLFKQKRLGKNGKIFTILKFRTMRKDAEIILEENIELYDNYIKNDYKLHPSEDPRLIRFGALLRKTSLDELPQFFCVLKGDMSLVGPRPIVPQEIERYEGHERDFLSVKPGITGLWQVSGRSEIEYPQRKYLDLLYVKNKSLFLDFKILLKTIVTVVRKSGAH